MKAIFVKRVYLWPRFRDLVDDCLAKHRYKSKFGEN